MNKIILLLLLVPFFNFAQEQPVKREKAKTTTEEYNYLTQGYKIGLETGQDLKAGYELNHLPETSVDKFKIRYSVFKETKSNHAKAILITLTKIKDSDNKVLYLCLPFNNKELLAKFYDETLGLGLSMNTMFEVSNLAMLSSLWESKENEMK